MRAPEVLANEGMKQCLTRAGIAHLDRIACLNDSSRTEIIVDHRLDRSRANLGRNVARFQLPQHLMDESAVRYLDRDFHQMLMASVHRISRLESSDIRPAPLKEHGPRLGRANIEVRVFDGIFA